MRIFPYTKMCTEQKLHEQADDDIQKENRAEDHGPKPTIRKMELYD